MAKTLIKLELFVECEFDGAERFTNQRDAINLLTVRLQHRFDELIRDFGLLVPIGDTKPHTLPRGECVIKGIDVSPVEIQLSSFLFSDEEKNLITDINIEELQDRLEWTRLLTAKEAISMMTLLR